jgi:nucleotide-binding universal stress UspA family protein
MREVGHDTHEGPQPDRGWRRWIVHLVCAYDSDARLRAPYASQSWVTREDERYAAAGALLTATAELARRHLPPGRLRTELAHELPVRALLDRAADAEMLVLGTTRFACESGQPPRALGPVARACLRLAHCPVVIVAPDDQLPRHGSAQRRRHATPRQHGPRAAEHPPKSAEPATSMLAPAAR